MNINCGMRVSYFPTKPISLTKVEKSRVRKELPPNFKIGRIFELSGKTVVMHKDLPNLITHAAESVLKNCPFLLSRIPENKLIFAVHNIDQNIESNLRNAGRLVKIPQNYSDLQTKKHVLSELAEFLPDETDESLHLIASPHSNDKQGTKKMDEALNIRKSLDPFGYCFHIVSDALQGSYSKNDINRAISLIPLELINTLSPDSIVKLSKLFLEPSNWINISKKEEHGNGNVVEIQMLKDAYFGVGHDIVSIFACLGLEPLEIKFYPIGKDENKILCLSKSRFISKECGVTKILSEVKRLFDENSAQKALLSGEGELLWFSFVGLYNAMSRFLASSGYQKANSSQILSIMKRNGAIMRTILSLLRKKFDPSYPAEVKCDIANKINEADLENAIANLPEDEAKIMKFCFNFVLSVRKTDYFDVNRLKEISSFILNANQLKEYIDDSFSIRPEEILLIHRRSKGIDLHPVYAVERKTKTERYVNADEFSLSSDIPMVNIIGPYVRNVRQIVAAKALEIMPFIEELTNRELNIFEGMHFIDENGKEYNICGLHPNTYLSVTAGALFSRPSNEESHYEEPTYIENISKGFGTNPKDIDYVSVKFLGRGGQRTISTVKVHSARNTNTFLAAVNRMDLIDAEKGPAEEEYKTLNSFSGLTKLLPMPFGFVSVPMGKINIGVLFKEFLMGLDCEQYFQALRKEESKRILFRAVGKAIGQLYSDTFMGSSDFKLSNMVFYRNNVKFCDICPFTEDMGLVKDGFIQLFDPLKTSFKSDIIEGIISCGDRGREFLGRIRNNMLYDQEDSWQSIATWEELNKIALAKGFHPEEYYKWELK